MRAAGITFISLALTSAVIGNAYYQKKQFYPSVVYITKSNPSMAVIYVQALILVVLMGKLMRKIFFGQLRAAEFEHLMERSWYAVTETCLAFTVFRDDFSPKFVALFTVLLFIKSFHWLAEERVDFMERSPVISWLFHLRVLSLLSVLGALDLQFVGLAYLSTITKGASVQLVFGFEYAILLTIIINIFIKYILHTLDLNSENPWDNKAVFLLYTELVMGFFKVILYIAFVAIMVRIYTLPLFAFRPMYYTMRAFKKALNDVILSRRAIRNMNTLYPDATREELAAADNVCIICREEMVSASKKLPCNHIFHTSCLRSWFQRQQTCPTCRLNILRAATPPAPAPPRPDPAPAPAPQPQQQVGGNPFPPGFMPFWQPFQHLQQQQQQQPAGAELPANQPSAPGTSPQVQGTTQTVFRTDLLSHPNQPPNMFPPGAAFPFFAPPPFPSLPFSVPLPPPPADLAQLSEEELRRMEGTARENVEARLLCLRNIQLLLDAAVVLMQQYSTAAPAPAPAPATSCSRTEDDGGSRGASSSSAAAPSTPVEQVGPSSECSTDSDPVLTKEQEEIRRRRLEKFASQTLVPEQDNV